MRRMNSASRGLRPTVGLRRPGAPICVGEGRRPARKRLRRPISIGMKASGRRSACAPNEFGLQGPPADDRPAPTGRSHLRRRRPTPGAQRLGRPISIGATAFGRRSACADREIPFASAFADARRAAPWKADFNRRKSLRPTTGLRRPGDPICVGEGRRPARKRLGRPISIGAKASGRRSACADREISFASAKADARRAAPWKADFNRRNSLRPTTGLRRLKERKMPTSRLSHRRAPRVHRFKPELIA